MLSNGAVHLRCLQRLYPPQHAFWRALSYGTGDHRLQFWAYVPVGHGDEACFSIIVLRRCNVLVARS
jgi:hypothetical protein